MESESGTVHEETITKPSPNSATIFPENFVFPLIESQIPIGIKHNGIQNQSAASSIGFMCVSAARGLINLTGIISLSGVIG